MRSRSLLTEVAAVSCLLTGLLVGVPSRAAAQADTARVTYRTREIVFISAGRAERLAVGDTIELVTAGNAAPALAVVVSAALHTASARLLTPDAPVAVGILVRFVPRAGAEAAVPAEAPGADTVSAPAVEPDTISRPAPPPRTAWREGRWRGGFQLDQIATSSGGARSLTSQQTVGGFSLIAPLAHGFELRTRVSSRWRGGAAGTTTGLEGFSAIVYQLEARLAPEGGRWSASIGRFVPAATTGLGYTDGALLEVRVAPGQRIGFMAGYVPSVDRLRPSSAAKRAAAYWAFGNGGAFSGSLAASAEWEMGLRRRTVSGQTYWRASSGVSLSLYGDVDLGAPWRAGGAQLSALYANVRAALPLGFRAGLGVESHQAIRLWETVVPGDTTPLPGRLNGLTFSLGRNVAGLALDLSGTYLKRASDASPTWRGMFIVSRRGIYVTATAQHGDLFDYGAVSARWILPSSGLGFSASLGLSASTTKSAGGGFSQTRISVQPELSRRLGGALFFSAGGDVGSYAGRTTTYLHAGLSYRFR